LTQEEKNVWICFKIHANMDPKHRDRLAFIKLYLEHLKGTSRTTTLRLKELKILQPQRIFAKKEIVDISYPGDIVGFT
jgi:peptide chain release factor 3